LTDNLELEATYKQDAELFKYISEIKSSFKLNDTIAEKKVIMISVICNSEIKATSNLGPFVSISYRSKREVNIQGQFSLISPNLFLYSIFLMKDKTLKPTGLNDNN